MIKLYLFDIEGTTTDINFVHKVLFPYSTEHMDTFLSENKDHPIVAKALLDVQATVLKENSKSINFHESLITLHSWIKVDRKHPALKEIQGLIWDQGYSRNDFQGHVYSDVKPFFKRILEAGQKIGIYSSGSVHAQKLIFGYSTEGDLTPMISYFFDTKVGAKREKRSYLNIASEVGMNANEILFFSDITEEIVAAEEAGLKVTHVKREGTKPSHFNSVESFSSIL